MSRRQVSRMASPEEVFAQRRGETPYQIYFEISNIGRNVESSKKRARWKFCFGEEGREHEVTLVHSLMSGKKKTIFNGEVINEAQKMTKEWSFAWSFGAHLLRVGINFEEYHLVIDSLPFMSFSRRDPYLAAQLEATKRDSMKSLKSDEERRFERLGYAGPGGGSGGGGAGNRSRTGERKRSSLTSANSAGSRRASSTGRGRDSDRSLGPRRLSDDGTASNRSGSADRRAGRRASDRASSTSRMRVGIGGEVNPFDAYVGEGSFDPLNKPAGVAASGAGAGGGYANGAGGAAGGSWPGGGGDAAAVLSLGMQFEAMGGNSQFPQQQQQFARPQQPPQQQQEQYQTPFDQGGYQQYDQTGFPPNVQQTYQVNPQQAGSSWPFGDADAIVGGAGGADGGAVFSGGAYPDQAQQQQQPYQQEMLLGGMAEQSAESSKASLDPWDMARGGMVNIDDITDTKHLPAVEVKPFTNDHRPLADLVREAPAKVANPVMIERPEPPTHVAVAIVPYQDHALPVGTDVTDTSLAGVLGREREVGGDVWCAALLLSAWLLENPEVVRGLDVLELGSGLGLCGITAGYLAKSVMLTDYVDELLVNLRHNVEVNRTPRVVSTVAPRKPIEHRGSRSGLKEDADHAPATGPHRGRPELQRCGRQRDGQRQQQQQQQQQTSEPEHQQHLQIDDLREKTMAEITSRQRHHRVPDGDAPSDTVGQVGSPGRRDLERRGHKENSPVRISAAATANDAVVVSDGRDFLPPPRQGTPLLPLSRADVRKLDWTTYAGGGEAGRASGGEEGGGGWWWDDRGPDTSQSAVFDEIRQTARGAAIGGPVTRTTDPAVALGADDDDSDRQDDSNDRNSDNDMGGQGEASGFDEFVLCSVFRSRDSTSRGEGAKSTR
eukprot:jgi/Undpi1/11373/HiC_scaffold_30.g13670.m1